MYWYTHHIKFQSPILSGSLFQEKEYTKIWELLTVLGIDPPPPPPPTHTHTHNSIHPLSFCLWIQFSEMLSTVHSYLEAYVQRREQSFELSQLYSEYLTQEEVASTLAYNVIQLVLVREYTLLLVSSVNIASTCGLALAQSRAGMSPGRLNRVHDSICKVS